MGDENALEGGTSPPIGEGQEVERSIDKMFPEAPPESEGDTPQDISPETPPESEVEDIQRSLEKLANNPDLARETLRRAADSAAEISRPKRRTSSSGRKSRLHRALNTVVTAALLATSAAGLYTIGSKGAEAAVWLLERAKGANEKVVMKDEGMIVPRELEKLEQEFREGTISNRDLEELITIRGSSIYETSMALREEYTPENLGRFGEAVRLYNEAFEESQGRNGGMEEFGESQGRNIYPENSPRQA